MLFIRGKIMIMIKDHKLLVIKCISSEDVMYSMMTIIQLILYFVLEIC